MLLNYRGKAIINIYFISTVSLCSCHCWLVTLNREGWGETLLEIGIYSGFDLQQRFDASSMWPPTVINRRTNIKVDKQTSGFCDIDSSPQVLFPILQAHIHVPKEAECSFLVQVTIQPVKHFLLCEILWEGFPCETCLWSPSSLLDVCIIWTSGAERNHEGDGWPAFVTSGTRCFWLPFPWPRQKLWESLFSLYSREGPKKRF